MPHPQPQGFLAVPRTGKGRGVLVLHPWWGLNDPMRAFCSQLAEVGFVASAADLYDGKVAATIKDAESLLLPRSTSRLRTPARSFSLDSMASWRLKVGISSHAGGSN